MRHLVWFTAAIILVCSVPVRAVELQPLSDCMIKVFKGINRSHVWSGKAPDGCQARIYVEKRADGIFITAWNSGSSANGWVRLSLSSALGFFEIADGKAFKIASRDITERSVRIERCLNSIIRTNDPLECRDHATKTYSAGEELGIEHKRSIWLDDNGRHVVAEYAYGDTRAAISPPADLFDGPALPPGTDLKIHVFDAD